MLGYGYYRWISCTYTMVETGAMALWYLKKTLWFLFMDRVQLSQGYRATLRRPFTFYHSGGAQEVLVLIWSTSEGWKAGLTLEPPSGFEPETPGLGIKQPITNKPLLHIMISYHYDHDNNTV